MSFMQKAKSLFILLAVIFSTSCSLFERDNAASVSFSIDRATAGKIAEAASARSVARNLAAEEMEGISNLKAVMWQARPFL